MTEVCGLNVQIGEPKTVDGGYLDRSASRRKSYGVSNPSSPSHQDWDYKKYPCEIYTFTDTYGWNYAMACGP